MENYTRSIDKGVLYFETLFSNVDIACVRFLRE